MLAGLLALCLQAQPQEKNTSHLPGNSWNIADAGAHGDGITLNTAVIQGVINRCAQNGGGVVYVPAGKFLTGTIYLKDGVNLHLSEGAVLLGSTNPKDYPLNIPAGSKVPRQSLLFAENARHISVTGNGCIDGQGHSAAFYKGDDATGRPRIIHFIDCNDVKVQDITLKNAAFWVQYYSGCDGLQVHGIKVYSHSNWNNDGLDIDSRNVTISDCIIDSDDDALCFKSESRVPCENITVNNCVLASNCNAIKMGTASKKGFKNISIANCAIHAASEDNIRHWKTNLQYISADKTVLAGIAIESVDGGQTEGITISNITMKDVQTPVFIRLGDRSRNSGDTATVSAVRNVQISNITAVAASLISSSVTGIPGHPVENVLLNNLLLVCPGGGTAAQAAQQLKEQEKAYPENRMFGNALPAAGVYAKHVKGLSLQDVRLILSAPDLRPAFASEDAEAVTITNMQLRGTVYEQPVVKLVQSNNVLVSGCSVDGKIKRFLQVEGERSNNIGLQQNNLHQAAQPVEKGAGVQAGAVWEK